MLIATNSSIRVNARRIFLTSDIHNSLIKTFED
jgi:hypothetical protein